MKGEEEFVLSIIKKLESIKEGLVCFSYVCKYDPDGREIKNPDAIFRFIAMDNYEFYKTLYFEKRTFNLIKVWRKISDKMGLKIVFCYRNPIESQLVELLKDDNLIMNV